eukprot:3313745-Alexandrium_andersonii.AAC.1
MCIRDSAYAAPCRANTQTRMSAETRRPPRKCAGSAKADALRLPVRGPRGQRPPSLRAARPHCAQRAISGNSGSHPELAP